MTLISLSDERLKENITEYIGGYEIVKNLQAKTFDWKSEDESNDCRGFIAQDFINDVPKSLTTFNRNIDGVDTELYGMSQILLIPELWSATRTLIQDKEVLEQENIDMGITISYLTEERDSMNQQMVDMGVTIAYLLAQH